MKKVLILSGKDKPAVVEAIRAVEPWLRRRTQLTVDVGMEGEVGVGQFELAVVFGGDGAVLQAARKLASCHVPILGINTGKLGFLTETTSAEAKEILAEVLDGPLSIAERMMLECELWRGGQRLTRSPALNDVVVSRTALSRLIAVDFFVNDELVTTYRADGLIVSTPVGSTAHSLSAGGPIVFPELDAFVISPICPHTLSNRPLVLPATMEMQLEAREFAEPPALTIDGQVCVTLSEGDRVAVRRARESVKLVRAGRKSFFDTLQSKLDWRGQPRYVR